MSADSHGTNADEPSAPSTPTWRRYVKWIVGVLAAFGIFAAVGGRIVDEFFPAAAEIVRGGGALRITAREDPHGGSDGFEVATRAPAGLDPELRRASSCESLLTAAKHVGAVDVNQSITDLLLEGHTYRDVAIVDMRARILKREPALAGARISCASAGAIDSIGVTFNLDESSPLARTTDPHSSIPGKPYFGRGNVVSLTKNELQPVQVVARVSDSYVEWDIDADATIDGKERKITINSHGRPFRITASRPVADYGRHFEWVWYENKRPYLYASDKPKHAPARESVPSAPTSPHRTARTRGCGGGLSVGPVTSCGFARNVRKAFSRSGGAEAATVTALSPTTQRRYTMSCSGGHPHECTGANGASVYFP